MAEGGTPRQASGQQLEQIIAGQARADQRFEELFRRLGKAETMAGEARDTAREVVTILREQDTAVRLAEMRAEVTGQVSALRQDVVAANGTLRKDLDAEVSDREQADEALAARIVSLEAERNRVVGVAAFFSWLARVAPWLLTVGVATAAAFELKK